MNKPRPLDLAVINITTSIMDDELWPAFVDRFSEAKRSDAFNDDVKRREVAACISVILPKFADEINGNAELFNALVSSISAAVDITNNVVKKPGWLDRSRGALLYAWISYVVCQVLRIPLWNAVAFFIGIGFIMIVIDMIKALAALRSRKHDNNALY